MKKLLTYQFAFILTLASVKPVAGFGRETGERSDMHLPGIHFITAVADTIPSQVKPVENQGEASQEVKLPDIKEVPKSRRKMKPTAVPAPLPVKPIKVIQPKIIRPKIGLTL